VTDVVNPVSVRILASVDGIGPVSGKVPKEPAGKL
jgi:hypothetical protein